MKLSPAFETGERFTKLTIIKEVPKPENLKTGGRYYDCICDCGKEVKAIYHANLKKGNTRSCGCYNNDRNKEVNTKHGMSATSEYNIHQKMINRCNKETDPAYKYYGERGIKVCDRWLSFENFIEDMGKRPTEEHSLDRINNDGNYEPSNCRWATATEQQRNKKNVKKYLFKGEMLTLPVIAEITGIDRDIIYQRIIRGWTDETVFTTPIEEGKKRTNSKKYEITNHYWKQTFTTTSLKEFAKKHGLKVDFLYGLASKKPGEKVKGWSCKVVD